MIMASFFAQSSSVKSISTDIIARARNGFYFNKNNFDKIRQFISLRSVLEDNKNNGGGGLSLGILLDGNKYHHFNRRIKSIVSCPLLL
jgi:hypothetical protein